MNLAQHRKIFVLVASMMVTTILNKMGLDAEEMLGADFNILIEAAVDLLIIGGVPAVLTWAQPNDESDTIWRYWRPVVVGAGAVVVAIGLTAWFAR